MAPVPPADPSLASPSDLRSFLIADVRGYTRYTAEHGDEAASELAGRFAALTRDGVGAYGGTLLELRGDEALCVFPSARQAMRAAIELQRRYRDRGGDGPAIPLGVGMGLDAGEAVPTEGGFRGGALNLAARLCTLAQPGQILASEGFVHVVRHVPGIGFGPTKRVRVKGLERPVGVIEIVADAPLPPLPAPPARPGRRPRHAIVLATLAAAIAAIAVVVVWHRSAGEGPSSIAGDSVVAIDATSAALTTPVRLGATPGAVAAGERAVWVLDADGGTVSRIDPGTGELHPPVAVDAPGTPAAIALGDGYLWVVMGRQSTASQVHLAVSGAELLKLDPRTAVEFPRSRVPLPQPAARSFTGQSGIRVASGGGRVWVVNPAHTVSVIDPVRSRIIGTVTDVDAGPIAVEGTSAWVVDAGPAIVRIAGGPAKVTDRIRVPAISLSALAIADGAAWAVDPYGGQLYRIELEGQHTITSVPVGHGADAVTAAGGAIWVANPVEGVVREIDIDRVRVVARIPLGNPPLGLAAIGNTVWVTVGDAAQASVSAASSCGDVVYGGPGVPDGIIVSDLPMQGAAAATTFPMTAAIGSVLAQHRFRAGAYRIGYQACDDATAQAAGYDALKCVANARSYASDPRVVGVVGAYNSACTAGELPILNSAPGGQVAIVSPTNSDINLTHEYPDIRGGTGGLYPTEVRNYARVYPANDTQAAAAAMLLRRLGRHRVFVVRSARDLYAEGIAVSFGHAAKRLSLRIAGQTVWDERSADPATLLTQIRSSRADAVLLAGLLDYGISGRTVGRLRAALGEDVTLVGDDGFLPIPVLLRESGGGARGMYVTAAVAWAGNLPKAGRAFLHRFAETHPEQPDSGFTAYAAEATEVLLDAIARSDGTRRSITANLLDVQVRDGLLGSFGFDLEGDPTRAPVTVFRIAPGHHIDGLPFDYQDSSFFGVFTPGRRVARVGSEP